ncbi:hypothetical protein [Streptomyces sp. NPDC057302]|uniref:hypothetical protein n=1 Tax=Streptomyces sp. NPDC057302 TaxID=3346094 RepID=UPI00362E49B1
MRPPMRISRLGKSLATLTAATAVILGGSLVTAPTASAVGGSACEKNVRNHDMLVGNLGATARKGPSNNYAKRMTLQPYDTVYVRCYAVNSHGNRWYYGDLPRTSARGWVYDFNLQEL